MPSRGGSRLGDVIAILNNVGTTVAEYRYDAYGNCLEESGPNTDLAESNPIRYRSYYYDEDTGLYYLNARYYNPKLRRFISPDNSAYLDTGNPQGLNLYAYCGNDPVSHSDPSGRFVLSSFLIGLGIAIGIGAIAGAAAYAASEVISLAITGDWSWSWAQFVGSTAGGALGGALLYLLPKPFSSIIAGISGAVSTSIGMALENEWEGADYSALDIAVASIFSGAVSASTVALGSRIRIQGVNAGRNSYSAISQQIYTKFRRGIISRISSSTFGKMLKLNLIEGISGDIASGIMDAFDINLFWRKIAWW